MMLPGLSLFPCFLCLAHHRLLRDLWGKKDNGQVRVSYSPRADVYKTFALWTSRLACVLRGHLLHDSNTISLRCILNPTSRDIVGPSFWGPPQWKTSTQREGKRQEFFLSFLAVLHVWLIILFRLLTIAFQWREIGAYSKITRTVVAFCCKPGKRLNIVRCYNSQLDLSPTS